MPMRAALRFGVENHPGNGVSFWTVGAGLGAIGPPLKTLRAHTFSMRSSMPMARARPSARSTASAALKPRFGHSIGFQAPISPRQA